VIFKAALSRVLRKAEIMRRGNKTAHVLAGICAAALAASVSACASSPSSPAATGVTSDRTTLRSIDAPGWEFSYPDAVGAAGNRVWVGNSTGSVTEINATTGALIRAITASRYDLYQPTAITIRGNTVWIANSSFNSYGTNNTSVTEINATTGALIRVITARRYDLLGPVGITTRGNTVWVANSGATGEQIGSVTEINATTGALVRVVAGSRYQLDGPTGIAITGNTVWVANGGSVTEINATSGALIRVITARRYQLNGLIGIAATGNAVLTATDPEGGNVQTVTEINARTGALIRVGSSSSLPDMAFAFTADRYGAWVVSNDVGGKGGGEPGGVLAEFSGRTGELARALSPPILANSNGGGGIAADGGYIWVTGTNFWDGAGWLAKFDAATGALVMQVIAGDAAPATTPPPDTELWPQPRLKVPGPRQRQYQRVSRTWACGPGCASVRRSRRP
jgi:hypothetical protein